VYGTGVSRRESSLFVRHPRFGAPRAVSRVAALFPLASLLALSPLSLTVYESRVDRFRVVSLHSAVAHRSIHPPDYILSQYIKIYEQAIGDI
jgi:hypothetical protein